MIWHCWLGDRKRICPVKNPAPAVPKDSLGNFCGTWHNWKIGWLNRLKLQWLAMAVNVNLAVFIYCIYCKAVCWYERSTKSSVWRLDYGGLHSIILIRTRAGSLLTNADSVPSGLCWQYARLSLSVLIAILQVDLGSDTRMSPFWILLELEVTRAIKHAKLQANHHHNKPTPSFLQTGCPSCCWTNSVRALKES